MIHPLIGFPAVLSRGVVIVFLLLLGSLGKFPVIIRDDLFGLIMSLNVVQEFRHGLRRRNITLSMEGVFHELVKRGFRLVLVQVIQYESFRITLPEELPESHIGANVECVRFTAIPILNFPASGSLLKYGGVAMNSTAFSATVFA